MDRSKFGASTHASYTAAFEMSRVVGRLLAPDDLQWLLELPSNAPSTQMVVHLSCMAHFTPHIPLLAQRILQKIGLDCLIVGGPENCCGAIHAHFGDEDMGQRVAKIAQISFKKVRPQKVLSICPDCDEIFDKYAAPGQLHRNHNISELFIEHLDRLRPLMTPLKRRVIVHYHDVNEARRTDAARVLKILQAIPDLEIIDAKHARGPKVHCQMLHPMPAEDRDRMFLEASQLGADAIVMPYHSCYRQHCKMQIQYGIDVHHYFSMLALSLGIPFTEPFKEVRLLDDLDAAIDVLRPKILRFGYNEVDVRNYLQKAVYC